MDWRRISWLSRLVRSHAALYELPAFARTFRLIRGRPFSFAGHEYLREIYSEHHPYTVIEKAAQMGASEFAITKAMWTCLRYPRCTVIYFFPTDRDVADFSQQRMSPALRELRELGWNESMRALADRIGEQLAERGIDVRDALLVEGPDNIGLKQVGASTLYFRGMQSSIRMKSIPADFLIFDELDEAPPEFKPLALERLSHSTMRWVLELSTPTLPDYGIDIEFQRSDQRYWHVECGCRDGTVLEETFPECLAQWRDGRVTLRCPRCGRDELDVRRGRWVAHCPEERERRGYHLSQLFSTVIPPAEILREYERTRNLAEFYNSKLGKPYAGDRMPLTREDVLRCLEPPAEETEPRPGVWRTMGVDQGRLLHVVASEREGERRRIIKLAVVDSFAEVGELIRRLRVSTCVIDALPNQHSARGLAEDFPGRVYLCYYSDVRQPAQWDHRLRQVVVDRTECLDHSVEAMCTGAVRIALRHSPLLEMFVRHLTAIAKILEEDPQTGRQRYRYIRTGEDHFAHANAYDELAGQRERVVPVVLARPGAARRRAGALVKLLR